MIGNKKRCLKCGEVKPLVCFRLRKATAKRPRASYDSYCLVCHNEYKKQSRKRQQETNDPRLRRAQKKHDLKRRYGLTDFAFWKMKQCQSNRCANPNCRKEWTTDAPLVIDHDHKTGKVRGLLCNGCNSAIGHIREDEHIALGLIEYLRNWDKGLIPTLAEVGKQRELFALMGESKNEDSAA